MTFEMKYEVRINWVESGVRALLVEGAASVRTLRWEEAGLWSVPYGGAQTVEERGEMHLEGGG